MVDDNEITERIRMVEADLAVTNDFIKGVLAVSAALRGSAITLWVALLGFAFSQEVSELALLAVAIVVIFLIVDLYHGWLYAEALKHARGIEKLLAQYYNAISRYRDEPAVLTRFRGVLRAYRYGHYRSLPTKFGARNLAGARPRLIYLAVYPALAAIALAVYIAFLAGGLGAHSDPARLPSHTHRCYLDEQGAHPAQSSSVAQDVRPSHSPETESVVSDSRHWPVPAGQCQVVDGRATS